MTHYVCALQMNKLNQFDYQMYHQINEAHALKTPVCMLFLSFNQQFPPTHNVCKATASLSTAAAAQTAAV